MDLKLDQEEEYRTQVSIFLQKTQKLNIF